MKSIIQHFLQTVLGFKNYLFVFSLFKIITLRIDKKEADFFGFLKFVDKTHIVLDIGANLGIMSYYMAGKAKKVLAYEPVPENYNTLKRIISLFRLTNIELLQFALGNERKVAEMILPEIDHVKKQGLSHMADVDPQQSGRRFNVEVFKLDDTVNQKVDAIKMDVENFEFQVLQGAERIMKNDRPLIYTELWDNDNRSKCFELVKKFNYKIKVLQNDHLIEYDPKIHKHQNFFFIP